MTRTAECIALNTIVQPDPVLSPPAICRGAAVAGLYVHTPFCFHKCHYCDFYSLAEPSAPGDRQAAFVDRLIAELRHRAAGCRLRPRTIFVGGGTPTLLRVDLWRFLLAALNEQGVLDAVEEFTVEANPETVTPELMDVLVAGGVNRVSVGCQSFDPGLLKMLERWHDPANVPAAVRTIRAAGIANLNLDLIFAIPGQTMAQLDADLDAALALQPTHLSYYGLTYEPNTAMTKRLQLQQFRPIAEATEREMFERVIDRLAAAGFEHYEISNWAREKFQIPNSKFKMGDHRCRHNLLYWSNENWLGVGPSAASHVHGYRWKNEAHLGRYLDSHGEPPVVDAEHLDAEARVGEALMMRLRLLDGVPADWLHEHVPPGSPRRRAIDELIGLHMLEETPTRLRLTRQGLFVADAIVLRVLDAD